MHLSIILTGLLLSYASLSYALSENSLFPVRSDDDPNIMRRDAGIDKTCARIRALERLDDIANNQAALDALSTDGKLARARIDWIKEHTAEITADLDNLTSNTTLTTECDAINAQRDTAHQCKKLARLEKLLDFTNNKTALDEQIAGHFLSQSQRERLQRKIESAELTLQELKANSTLLGICSNVDSSLQQNGAIGDQSVDGSGAISMTKSIANVRILESNTVALAYLASISTIASILWASL
ncbi:hypothetical protein DDE83_007185 [Stemphylium lycopersici]|uniref:Uncharacterized protein n=1 Tax=Stemphylium lycopersici TaxID=183478 RepID=A0A364MWW1_STELY|nr:hypothetical protein DDE83_007185 [Stemphylium lycopersici]